MVQLPIVSYNYWVFLISSFTSHEQGLMAAEHQLHRTAPVAVSAMEPAAGWIDRLNLNFLSAAPFDMHGLWPE